MNGLPGCADGGGEIGDEDLAPAAQLSEVVFDLFHVVFTLHCHLYATWRSFVSFCSGGRPARRSFLVACRLLPEHQLKTSASRLSRKGRTRASKSQRTA